MTSLRDKIFHQARITKLAANHADAVEKKIPKYFTDALSVIVGRLPKEQVVELKQELGMPENGVSDDMAFSHWVEEMVWRMCFASYNLHVRKIARYLHQRG
jgi:hypothetical protein